MRQTLQLTSWRFCPDTQGANWETVTVPHTWNALDGQSGGTYLRTCAMYETTFRRPAGDTVYIRFEGANINTNVYLNGTHIGEHRGGYSAFQMDLTGNLLDGENTLRVLVSNEKDAVSYPATADYTFFGGIYRPVSLICFQGAHFSMEGHGSCGVFVTPLPGGQVHVDAHVCGGQTLKASVDSPDGQTVCTGTMPVQGDLVSMDLTVDSPLFWNGRKAANLYVLHLALDDTDALDIPFGFRSVAADADRGFLLNGQPYPLHGVSRHQDRENLGWAIGEAEHREDIGLILEIGANTVRLPHYQQADCVLDLCDQTGLVVWAETPLNSEYLKSDEADAIMENQLVEMICQLYNHPSICFWSLANEISIGGVSNELLALLRKLQETAHTMDPGRITVMANMGSVDPASPLWRITDASSVNQYLGWYDGSMDDYGPFLDRLHALLPDRPLGLSEYGAEAVLTWHSDQPRCMDYTEEYQALVHESAWKAISERPWLMGAWVWNMFDFAACHRDEGGVRGRNNKGLMTFDRKTRKDAFWFYKACWSDEPFVYITGKRFLNRTGDTVDIKVYSNQEEVTLRCGDQEWKLKGKPVFLFRIIPFDGTEMHLTARAGDCVDTLTLRHVDAPDPSYVLPQPKTEVDSRVRQWFADLQKPKEEIVHREGYFTMQDMMDDIVRCPEAMAAIEQYWAGPLELSAPEQAERLRKGGSMPPAQIWRYIKKYLPEAAYDYLDAALANVRHPD